MATDKLETTTLCACAAGEGVLYSPETCSCAASDDANQAAIPTLPNEHRARQLLSRAMTILNVAAGEGVFWEGVEEPENFMFEVANELGFGNSDDPWEDMIRMLNQ